MVVDTKVYQILTRQTTSEMLKTDFQGRQIQNNKTMNYYSINVYHLNDKLHLDDTFHSHQNALLMNYLSIEEANKVWNKIISCDKSKAQFYCEFMECLQGGTINSIEPRKYSKMDINNIKPLGKYQQEIEDNKQ